MRYRFVTASHPVCLAELEGDAEDFFEDLLDPVSGAVVATEGGQTIGWLRFECEDGVFYPAGTWVEYDWRHKGIAQELWGRCMARFSPRRVQVRTMSIEGRRLVGSLVSWFPKVEFEVLT